MRLSFPHPLLVRSEHVESNGYNCENSFNQSINEVTHITIESKRVYATHPLPLRRMSRCESLVLYRIMYGNRAMVVQQRNNFVVGSDNTEIVWGPWRLFGVVVEKN